MPTPLISARGSDSIRWTFDLQNARLAADREVASCSINGVDLPRVSTMLSSTTTVVPDTAFHCHAPLCDNASSVALLQSSCSLNNRTTQTGGFL